MTDTAFLILLASGLSLFGATAWLLFQHETSQQTVSTQDRALSLFGLVLGFPWLLLFRALSRLAATIGRPATPGQVAFTTWIALTFVGLVLAGLWHDTWERGVLAAVVGREGELLFVVGVVGIGFGVFLGHAARRAIRSRIIGGGAATVVFVLCVGGMIVWISHLSDVASESYRQSSDQFRPMLPALLELADATRTAPPESDAAVGNIVWIDADTNAIAASFWQLAADSKASGPDSVVTVCYSARISVRVGDYVEPVSGRSVGPAIREDLEVWLVDLRSRQVVGRKIFQNIDPPVVRGAGRSDKDLLLNEIKSWLGTMVVRR